MDKKIFGVAALPARYKFFRSEVFPNLYEMGDEVWVYRDDPCFPGPDLYSHSKMGGKVEEVRFRTFGDAGKFLGFVRSRGSKGVDGVESPGFYYFSCDDDLIYPLDYADRMIEWIEFFDRKAVVSLHGASFAQMPVKTFYGEKRTISCLADWGVPTQVLFPGTGVLAFHSSTLRLSMEDFPVPNMADIWMGKILQEQKVPAVVVPHKSDYLKYNWELPLEDTIWGQEVKRDFVQTAVVNQLSLNPGLHFFLQESEWEGREYPAILAPSQPPLHES